MKAAIGRIQTRTKFSRTDVLARDLLKNYELYILIIPTLLYFIIFKYLPMYGIQIAFKDFIPSRGIFGSEWIGFENFGRFFRAYNFWTILTNTLTISFYQLIVGFPLNIIFALTLNSIGNVYFKKIVQNVTYMPHFISMVVLTGIILSVLNPKSGMVTQVMQFLNLPPVDFISDPKWFKTVYVATVHWQNLGFQSIIYISALSAIDMQLHESAIIDGASRLKRIWYIDIPGIMPTAVILLILKIGNIMDVGFQRVFLLQNPLNIPSSEIIATYVYKVGIISQQFSFSTSVGLFNSLTNFILLVIVNKIARSVNDTSLW